MSYPRGNRAATGRLLPPTTHFGRVLDGVLDRRGTSASEAERASGLAEATLSRLRHGYHGATFAVVVALERGLSLSEGEVHRLLVAGFNDAKGRRRRKEEP